MHDIATIQASNKSVTTRSKLGTKYTQVGVDLFGQPSFACHRIQKSENRDRTALAEQSSKSSEQYQASETKYIGVDLHINPNRIVMLPSFTGNRVRGGQVSSKSKSNLKSNKVKGELSKASKRKLNNAINWLSAAAKTHKVWSKQQKRHYSFKCAMITLTLPGQQADLSDYRFKKHMLGKFIDWMRKTKAVKNYIWKVEPQGNGNVHVHIVINQFIHYNDVRREWLKLCAEQGLVDNDSWKDNLQSVPCTEVKAIRKVKKVGAYIASYFSKKHEGRRKISGRLWGCSYELSDKNKLVIRADSFDTESLVEWWNNSRVRRKDIEVKDKLGIGSKKIGELAMLDSKLWREVVCDELYQLYLTHIWNIRSHMQSLPISYYKL